MAGTTVVICVDGLDPEYLDACETPNLTRLGGMGFLKTGQCMMPSVTNVNNVSLVTAAYPDTHGISSNYRLVRETGEEIYMESGEYVLAETMFQRLERHGGKSALVTSKDKLRTLLADGATIAVSSEQAPEWVVREVGAPPPIYSLEVNGWVVEAASFIMSRCEDLDVVYISTTDYAMHTYAPEEPESQRHLSILDEAVGELVESYPDVTLLLTADHGMSRKRRMVDLESALERYGMRAVAVPIIKDRYTVHHSNLGGCSYVYVDPGSGDRRGPKTGDALVEALKVLGETPGWRRPFRKRRRWTGSGSTASALAISSLRGSGTWSSATHRRRRCRLACDPTRRPTSGRSRCWATTATSTGSASRRTGTWAGSSSSGCCRRPNRRYPWRPRR